LLGSVPYQASCSLLREPLQARCLTVLVHGYECSRFRRQDAVDTHQPWWWHQVLRPAAVTYVFSLMMTSICKEYWQFILAQGILLGSCIGLLVFPATSAVSQYFHKKRGMALGLVIAGSSIGGVVFPIVTSKMLNDSSIGYGWSIRILAFIMAPLLAFSCVTVKARLPPRKTTFFIPRAFKNVEFSALVLAMFFMLVGMFSPLFFLPSYAVTRGMNPTLASYMLAIVNGASTFGRILPGFLSDKFGRINMFAIGGIMTGIVIFCFDKPETTATIVVYSIFIGFASGTIVSGGTATLSLCAKDPREIGTYMGMGGVAALIGPPVNGALFDHYGGFLQISIFSGVTCLVGGLIAFASKAATPEGLFGLI
jgi:MFS family permease